MNQIVIEIEIENKDNFRFLFDLLHQFSFIKSVKMKERMASVIKKSNNHFKITVEKKNQSDFFKAPGKRFYRNLDAKKLREEAWSRTK